MKSVLLPLALVAALATTACSHDERTPADGRAKLNLYAATGANALAPATARARPLVYVPNSKSGSVTIIDPATYRVLRTVGTGALPQHVVPAYDLATLWVTNDKGNSLTAIDPVTGQEGARLPVDDPYNLYFTPDGRYALVIAEERGRFDFRDPHTMKLVDSVHVDCKGLNHVEFTADDRYAIATCEFSGQLVKLDLKTRRPVSYLTLDADASGHEAMPQDIRASPDGRVFYVADMMANGIHLVDPESLRRTGFIATGVGAHGIVTGREGRRFYITNRGWNTVLGGPRGPGSVSVLDPATRRIVATWPVPGGGSPDMGNVSADGRELWVSGRYDDEVYVFDTTTGQLMQRIAVEREPHGVIIWPQPGRYSLGHTGNMR